MITSTIALALAALPVSLAATYNVQVGAGGNLVYDPEYVSAQPGDIINFTFNPKNHTVTQSSFDTPCVAAVGGVTTGFVPVDAGTTATRQFTVPSGNAPLWFYCAQTGHCAKGMVFAINPPADSSPNSFSAFKAKAQAGSSSSGTVSSGSASTTPAPPHWVSATATVTYGGSVYTTTYTSYDGTPPPTPAAVPADHKIIVGANGALTYSPANISASIGDTVTFEFHPKNHTVTQSSFLNPCEALGSTSGTPGFKSGFQPVASDATTFPTFQIKINDTAPIWGYCGQTGHCSQGMVFAINAVESGPNNFAAFLSLAKQSGSTNSSGTTAPSGTTASSTSTPSSKSYSAAVGFSSGSGAGLAFGIALSALVALWV